MHLISRLNRSFNRMEISPEIQSRLIDAYSEPQRAYHTLAHIDHMIANFETYFLPELREDDALLLEEAIWFHDVVYDPRSHDNEERSVETAIEWLKLSISTDAMRSLIMATKGHGASSPLEQKLIDLDLMILATSPIRYDLYVAQIRREYEFVPDADYRSGRAKVMSSFLPVTDLFLSLDDKPAFRDDLRAYAEANITREIAALRVA